MSERGNVPTVSRDSLSSEERYLSSLTNSQLMHPLFFKILRIELENSNFQTSVAAVFETNAATLKE